MYSSVKLSISKGVCGDEQCNVPFKESVNECMIQYYAKFCEGYKIEHQQSMKNIKRKKIEG